MDLAALTVALGEMAVALEEEGWVEVMEVAAMVSETSAAGAMATAERVAAGREGAKAEAGTEVEWVEAEEMEVLMA